MDALEREQSRPFAELEGRVGERRVERVRGESGEELLVDIRVEWLDRSARRLRVGASVDSAGTFRLERLEESVVVEPELHAAEPPGGSWAVWRQDDNGNRVVVSRGHTRREALERVAAFEACGHKQHYWASPSGD